MIICKAGFELFVMAEKKIDLKNIKYLSFEGGGGKGIVYMGAVRALQAATALKYYDLVESNYGEESKGVLGEGTLFPIDKPIKDRPFVGISGASAGALTAFMLAMGMNSKELQGEFDKTVKGIIAGEEMELSQFENFLDDPSSKFRVASYLNTTFASPDNTPKYQLITNGIEGEKLEGFGRIFLAFSILFNAPLIKRIKRGLHYVQFSASIMMKKFVLSDAIRIRGKKMVYKKVDTPVSRKTYIDFPKGSELKVPQDTLSTILMPSLTSLVSMLQKRARIFPKLSYYTHSLAYNKGVFPGLEPVEYFGRVMQEFLLDRILTMHAERNGGKLIDIEDHNGLTVVGKSPKEITFVDFFNLTGVDLLITGTNVTQHTPKYFSVSHTPDFPVIFAVALSMNLPIIFKPFYIKGTVHKGYSDDSPYNRGYNGFWVDGGMLNNYPIHAFDEINEKFSYISGDNSKRPLLYLGKPITTEIAVESPKKHADFCECILGFQLVDEDAVNMKKNKKIQEIYEDSFSDEKNANSLSYFSQLLDTFMHPAEEGQIRSELEREYSVVLNASGIETTDFASPSIHDKRAEFYRQKWQKQRSKKPWAHRLEVLNRKLGEIKKLRIVEAENKVREKLGLPSRTRVQ